MGEPRFPHTPSFVLGIVLRFVIFVLFIVTIGFAKYEAFKWEFALVLGAFIWKIGEKAEQKYTPPDPNNGSSDVYGDLVLFFSNEISFFIKSPLGVDDIDNG